MNVSEERISLLLVDDEVDFLEAAAEALSRRGFDITTSPDAAHAINAINEHPPDIVVLDVKMPGMDGIELFRRLNAGHPEIPIILLTGHGTLQQAFETTKEGVYEYLTKPCNMDALAEFARQAHRSSVLAADAKQGDSASGDTEG